MQTEFLYPTSTQYPFDPVCAAIVKALEARNYNVPGIRVEFSVYGSGEQRVRHVSRVAGDDFLISFGRAQGPLPGGRWNNCAAVRGVAMPCQKIDVYEDRSGPRFCLYVGTNWEEDRDRFMNRYGVNSKLNGEPRTYLLYRAECRCGRSWRGLGHTHPGQRSPLLAADNDIGREYDPEPGEPTEFNTAEVLETFRAYLQDVVLAMIEAHPEASERVDMFHEPEPIPVPPWAASLFCFGDRRDVDRIQIGQHNPADLAAADRYGMHGNGWRLVSLDVRNDGTVPEVAYDGFLWCGIPWVDGGLDPIPPIPGNTRGLDNDFIIRIRLKNANEVYIADHGAYERRRSELIAAAETEAMMRGTRVPDRFTQTEVNDFVCARARTIVPIHEYKGVYEQPVVLIRRELGFDEVEVPATQVAAQRSRFCRVVSPL